VTSAYGMVVLVDHVLDEPARAVRIDFGVPDQAPDAGIVGIAEGPHDLFTCKIGAAGNCVAIE
jgi:hypothetical protein